MARELTDAELNLIAELVGQADAPSTINLLGLVAERIRELTGGCAVWKTTARDPDGGRQFVVCGAHGGKMAGLLGATYDVFRTELHDRGLLNPERVKLEGGPDHGRA